MIRANDRGLGNTPPPEVEEPPRRKGAASTRNIVILVGIIAWIVVLWLFVLPNLTKKPTLTTAVNPPSSGALAPAVAAAAVSPAAAAAQTGAVAAGEPLAVPAPELTIDGRVLNLSGNAAGYKYLKLSLVVQFADPSGKFAKAKGTDLTTLENTFGADHAGALVAFNDILTTVVSDKTAADLATTQGKDQLRQELIGKFNTALAGTQDHVTYVLFSDFVMQ